jgi:hypothetical protein
MLEKDDAYYEPILDKTVEKFIKLLGEKERIDDEIAKLEQFMSATENLLSEEAAARFQAKVLPFATRIHDQVLGLRDAIKTVLNESYPARFTAAEVRDKVRARGFDFSSYKSDPLPSVSTTLRRLRESNEISYEKFEGVAVYQANPPVQIKSLPRLDSK